MSPLEAEHIFSNSKYYTKKREILSEKRDDGNKHVFTPESGNVDTYANH